MPIRVCLSTANTLTYPQGGHLWIFINWALGFRSCGCEVVWLDVVPPSTSSADLQKALSRLTKLLQPFDLDNAIAVDYLSENDIGRTVGASSLPILDYFKPFDLLFDLRYNLPARILAKARRSALLDIDPGQLQVALVGGAYTEPSHDMFFSIGYPGVSGARFPDAGKLWIHTNPCVFLPEWPLCPATPDGPWSTVAHWWGGWMVDDQGNNFPDGKREGFLPYMDVPSAVSAPFKLALNLDAPDEKQRIEGHGFEVVDAHEVAATPLDYRAFIQHSIGEFSAAKPSYVKLKTSWMSDRTLCYLASGKPCVVEDTGPIEGLGQFDKGLYRFKDREGAIQAMERVMADYKEERRAARAICEELFDSQKVCHRILTLAL
jgi:hypothetical protein